MKIFGTSVAWRVRALLRSAMQKVRQLWFTHTRLVRDNPAYLAAVTAGAASVLSQDSLTDLLAAVTAMVLAVAAATRRALSRC